jgi:energy-coupling factor transporter ATP-binding protein EcfA2
MSAADTTLAWSVQRFDVFLSYNSRDHVVVERIARRLRRAGFEPWLDRWSLTPGRVWHQELGAGLDASAACAVFVGADDFGPWELEELAVALDRAARQRDFRVFAVLLPGVGEPFDPNGLPHFLRTRMWVDFRRGGNDERALQDLISAIKGVPFGSSVPIGLEDDVAPYRGLLAFGEEDARFFFGRDREVQRLLEKLKSSRLVAVLGPSGSGKSSLVRAGLVPELRAGALADGERWQVLVLRPGAAPLTALAAQLATLQPGRAMQATLDELGRDVRSLHLCVELALADRPRDQRVLVVVDQLEEVFTLCRDERERSQLLSTLAYAASVPGGRTVVVLALRADFYVRCADYPDLAQLIGARQMLVGPMGADELRQAIEEPARRVGLELEEGLSDTILADVSAEPGALPLLEHALLELWERRRGGMLTLEGYREAGRRTGGAGAPRRQRLRSADRRSAAARTADAAAPDPARRGNRGHSPPCNPSRAHAGRGHRQLR